MTSIIVLHPGSLGDTILALPVLAALKSRHSSSLLHLVGHSALVDVLPGRSAVDAMASIEGAEFRELFSQSDMSPKVSNFFQQFELVVVWATDHDDSIKRALQSLKLSHIVVCSPGLSKKSDLHATDRFAATLSDHMPLEPLPEPRLTATESDRSAGAQWISDHGIHLGSDRLVAVHAGSGSPTKCWAPDNYARVVEGLQRNGAQVVLIEGPADGEATEAVASQIGDAVPRLRRMTLLSVIGVLSQCDAFLGNDSGLTHVATALGLPSVAVFGPTDPAIWGSRRNNLVALRVPGAPECFAISPDTVLGTLGEILRVRSASLAT
jgi:ADP-heptose:LPS heptosyltransferase